MSTYYTYRYTDPARNEVIYIGKGKNRRAYQHLTSKKQHPFMQRLAKMKREGVEPIIDFIAQGVDEEFAHFVEEEAIALHGRKNLGQGTLLNLTNGGETESGIKRLTQRDVARPDEVREKIRATMTGVPHSEERKQKFRDAARARVPFSCIKCKQVFKHQRHYPNCYKENE
jgi:hypothetical protein